MTKLPYFAFYPGDWQKDPNLRRATRSEKGLLMDLLCLMFESGERGVLVTGDVPWTDDEIINAVGGDPSTTRFELAELVRKGVLSRRKSDSSLFSRRLVREEALRQIRQENGRKGGNPVLLNQKPNQTVIHRVNYRVKQIPVIEYESEFESLWSRYPRKDSKKQAFKHFRASVKTPSDLEGIQQALSNYLRHLEINRTEARYIKNGDTWFNNWRDWLNWEEPRKPQPESRPVL